MNGNWRQTTEDRLRATGLYVIECMGQAPWTVLSLSVINFCSHQKRQMSLPIQCVPGESRLSQKHGFFKKLHNFYPIITKLCQNEFLNAYLILTKFCNHRCIWSSLFAIQIRTNQIFQLICHWEVIKNA